MGLPTIGRDIEGLLIFQEVIHPNESLQLAIPIDDLSVFPNELPQIVEQISQINLGFFKKNELFVGLPKTLFLNH